MSGQLQDLGNQGAEFHLGEESCQRSSVQLVCAGMVKVKMSVAILTYPGSALIGSFTKTVGMSGVTAPDVEAENELVLLAAEEAMKQFLALAPTLSP